ncbi:hypothetical protein Tco_0953016 [Tanacetum coccineum]|uniref:Uncharacterized protein n=1 Tax=Tanacetum coccineum TaxID=301880 RepID=A0ABQ5DYM7_9ASTR
MWVRRGGARRWVGYEQNCCWGADECGVMGLEEGKRGHRVVEGGEASTKRGGSGVKRGIVGVVGWVPVSAGEVGRRAAGCETSESSGTGQACAAESSVRKWVVEVKEVERSVTAGGPSSSKGGEGEREIGGEVATVRCISSVTEVGAWCSTREVTIGGDRYCGATVGGGEVEQGVVRRRKGIVDRWAKVKSVRACGRETVREKGSQKEVRTIGRRVVESSRLRVRRVGCEK